MLQLCLSEALIKPMRWVSMVLLCLLLLACGAPQYNVSKEAASAAELEAFLRQYPPLNVERELEKFLHLSDEMKSFIDTYVRSTGTSSQRLYDVHNALNSPSRKISYKADAHYSAEQAFHRAEANCLSYSAMFIAMGRHSSLRLSFQEVELPPSWSLGEKDLLLRFRHVNIISKVGGGRKKVVDFRMDRFSHFYPSKTISDREALSLQFNNLAVEAMFEDDWYKAFSYLHSAIIADVEKVVAWGNLGLALRRINRLALAERAYLKALSIDRRDYSVMSNLANLYRLSGRMEEAAELSKKSSAHRKRNPYYHFANAQRSFRSKDFDQALKNLQIAQKLKKREGNFAQLEAIIYWEQGRGEEAIQVMERAFEWEEGQLTSELIEKRIRTWREALATGSEAVPLSRL